MHDVTRAVYLSPHHDDVCFSVGQLVRQLMCGAPVNIFSISKYTDEVLQLPADANLVSQIRDREDDEFALLCGLTKRNLNQLDSPMRDLDPFDVKDLSNDVEQLSELLRPFFASTVTPGARGLLFCPAGIGMHRDHLVTRNAIVKDYEHL